MTVDNGEDINIYEENMGKTPKVPSDCVVTRNKELTTSNW